MEKTESLHQPTVQTVVDSGRIKVGSCGRFPVLAQAEVADDGRIRLGAGYWFPAER